jgi:cytochrome oxidase Cu insertion factor (SCO1/SenC/PrrC family)
MRGIAARLVGMGLLTLAGASGCTSGGVTMAEEEGPPPVAVADFALTDQAGRPVTRADLLGKVWVASFVFTRCATLCPQVSATMARLQHDLADEPGLVLVSFSVDPEHDTPAVLKEYAARYGADPGRWHFLTGRQDAVYDLIEHSFLLGVGQNRGSARAPGNEVTHSSRLVPVDRRGYTRGFFDGRQVDERGQPVDEGPALEAKLRALLREKS